MKGVAYCLLLCFAAILSGCTESHFPDGNSSGPTRTLVFYMGGDNNLSSELSLKLSSIQRFASGSSRVARGEINLLIYQDSPDGATLYRGAYGQHSPEVVGRYGREDSATAAVLSRVLEDCVAIAPAENYGLVVFSHASGWLPAGTLNTPRSVARSIITDRRHEMDLREFAAAIPSGLFDYVIFEACFMTGIEVAYELRDKVEYIVGSSAEMLSPGFQHIYPDMIDKLCSPLVDTRSSLCNAAQVYFDHYNGKSGLFRSATISVLRTSRLDDFVSYMQHLPSNLSTNTADIQYFDRNNADRHLFFDFEDYISRNAPQARAELDRLLANTVVFERATSEFLLPENGFRIDRHCGLTIYIPGRFPQLDEDYKTLAWSRAVNGSVKENM